MVAVPVGVATPSLVLDLDVVERNIDRMAQAAAAGGFTLRPHAKTHKCPQLAALQLRAGAVGLTVATIGEAEVFADAGFDDLFIAYPLWLDGDRVGRLRRLAERARVAVGVDSVAAGQRLAEVMAPVDLALLAGATGAIGRAPAAGRDRSAVRPVEATIIEVMIEVDSGHRRSGVSPADAPGLAVALAGLGLRVRGLFTFPGHSYDPGAADRAAREEEDALARAAAAVRAAGVPVTVLSGGSTPSAAHVRSGGPVGELRPGVYVFNDAQQLALGSCTEAQIALAAATTVVSAPASDRFVLDAGSKALGADRPAWTPGFGHLPHWPGALVSSLSEHHAVVTVPPGTELPRIGSTTLVVPNHVCSAVNLADELVVTRGGAVIDRWPVAARGAHR
ncbi:alanine racemase [Frankia sp. AiPa1]|uniref:alanine racemase n=1 Tax=Frankia sp. AiPa1 TaxID=573492 RepID=UPI0035A83621